VRTGALPFDQQRNATYPLCQVHTQALVNTRTGNYWTKVTDLQVESPGVPIVWTRTYNSQAVGETTVLGAGWQHPYNVRLITPAMSGGEAGRVIIMNSTGNRLRFDGTGTGPFDPWPGVNSTLVKSGATYIQTLRDQSQYIFRDSDGMLSAVRDPQGRQIDLLYNLSIPTQLDTIRDASNTARALQLSYSSGRISSVLDSLGSRSVSYGYDGQGNLTSVTDVRQQTTTYSYATASNHLLTRIQNALSENVERIGYKTSVTPSQVLTQTLQDGRNIAFAFPAPAALGGTRM
jgi:YD repeat-containing protein